MSIYYRPLPDLVFDLGEAKAQLRVAKAGLADYTKTKGREASSMGDWDGAVRRVHGLAGSLDWALKALAAERAKTKEMKAIQARLFTVIEEGNRLARVLRDASGSNEFYRNRLPVLQP